MRDKGYGLPDEAEDSQLEGEVEEHGRRVRAAFDEFNRTDDYRPVLRVQIETLRERLDVLREANRRVAFAIAVADEEGDQDGGEILRDLRLRELAEAERTEAWVEELEARLAARDREAHRG